MKYSRDEETKTDLHFAVRRYGARMKRVRRWRCRSNSFSQHQNVRLVSDASSLSQLYRASSHMLLVLVVMLIMLGTLSTEARVASTWGGRALGSDLRNDPAGASIHQSIARPLSPLSHRFVV
jgi:hypothetical protein